MSENGGGNGRQEGRPAGQTVHQAARQTQAPQQPTEREIRAHRQGMNDIVQALIEGDYEFLRRVGLTREEAHKLEMRIAEAIAERNKELKKRLAKEVLQSYPLGPFQDPYGGTAGPWSWMNNPWFMYGPMSPLYAHFSNNSLYALLHSNNALALGLGRVAPIHHLLDMFGGTYGPLGMAAYPVMGMSIRDGELYAKVHIPGLGPVTLAFPEDDLIERLKEKGYVVRKREKEEEGKEGGEQLTPEEIEEIMEKKLAKLLDREGASEKERVASGLETMYENILKLKTNLEGVKDRYGKYLPYELRNGLEDLLSGAERLENEVGELLEKGGEAQIKIKERINCKVQLENLQKRINQFMGEIEKYKPRSTKEVIESAPDGVSIALMASHGYEAIVSVTEKEAYALSVVSKDGEGVIIGGTAYKLIYDDVWARTKMPEKIEVDVRGVGRRDKNYKDKVAEAVAHTLGGIRVGKDEDDKYILNIGNSFYELQISDKDNNNMVYATLTLQQTYAAKGSDHGNGPNGGQSHEDQAQTRVESQTTDNGPTDA